jgi:regulator of nonsense transcripts 1
VFKPLVSLEAAYDKQMKDNQSRDNITVRWDVALNRKKLAYFFFPKDDNDLRLMPGDELKLRHRNASNRGPWEGLGNVIRFDQSEEVCLELKDRCGRKVWGGVGRCGHPHTPEP